MKTLLLFLIIACSAAGTRATTVMLTVTGRVSETDAASFFPMPPVLVGDQWTATMTWHYPTLATQIIEWLYDDPLGRLTFTVNGHTWESSGLIGLVGGFNFQAHLAAGTEAPAALTTPGGTSGVGLTWYGPQSMIANPTSLPQSFSDWNLPAAESFNLEVRTDIAQPTNAWLIRANAWETMTIQVIPEPASVWLSGLAALAALNRRRRGRV